MATHFYKLRVKTVQPETSHSVAVTLEVPPELQASFAYQQGQYLTVRTHLQGREVRRNYSLCSSPLDQEWTIAIKRVEGGLFSTWANTELKAGMELEVMPPIGKFFTPLHPAQKRRYLAIAAGSGITPILSIISTTLRTEPYSHLHWCMAIATGPASCLKRRWKPSKTSTSTALHSYTY